MNKVVAGGTQSLTPTDAAAIAEFLKSLAPLEEESFPPPSSEVTKIGATVYAEHCAECHEDSGRGGFMKAPPLAGSAIVQSADPSSLINAILYGAHPDGRVPAPFGAWESMKGFQQTLGDAEVAALASYLRSQWGHRASPVEAEQVKLQR